MDLSPLWRLRTGKRDGGPKAPGFDLPAQGSTALPQTVVPGRVEAFATPEPGDRAARILRMDWPQLKAAVSGCRSCALCKTRTHTVFGVGDEQADWLLVGEAPGAEEDARGEPFVGQAGRLLDNMLASVGLKRGANVYIANVLKCRPPGNRNPGPAEVAQCSPYLQRQIELIRPKLIIAMGRFAAQTLLDTDATIGSLRGTAAPLSRGAADRQLSPGVSSAQPAGQGEGLGGPVLRQADHGRLVMGYAAPSNTACSDSYGDAESCALSWL